MIDTANMAHIYIYITHTLLFLTQNFATCSSKNSDDVPKHTSEYAAMKVYENVTKANHSTNTNLIIPDEQRLLQKILKDYDSASRPTYVASNSVNVGFQMTLIQISQLDEVNQVLTLNVWIEQEWKDERLTWNPAEFSDLKIVRIPCEKLWLPDIVLYNSADDYTSGYMQIKAMVHSNGNVFWSPPAKLRSACKIDITYFPFDDQLCMMKFGSWAYDGWQLNITKRHEHVDMSNYVQNGEWDLLKVTVERFEIVYPCCDEPYPDLRFTIYMRRRTLYYLFNIIFPCLWLTVLSLISFWLPPDSGEKITLGITVLLAFSVFMLLIAENMPATSEFVPLIGIYLTVTMAMTSLSIILTVGVLHLHHKGPNHAPVPKQIRVILFQYLAPFLCISAVERYRLNRQERWDQTKIEFTTPDKRTHQMLSSTILEPEEQPLNSKDFATQPSNQRKQKDNTMTCSSGLQETGPYGEQPVSTFAVLSELCAEQPVLNQVDNNLINGGWNNRNTHINSKLSNNTNIYINRGWHACETPKNRSCSDLNSLTGRGWTETSENERRYVVDELTRLMWRADQQQIQMQRYLSMLLRKQSSEEHSLDIMNEWRMVAMIVDRTLFWLFLAVATLATIIILIVMPLFKPNKMS